MGFSPNNFKPGDKLYARHINEIEHAIANLQVSGATEIYVGSDTPDGYTLYVNPDGSDVETYYTKSEIDDKISNIQTQGGAPEVYVGSDTPEGYTMYINPNGDTYRDYYTKEEVDQLLKELKATITQLTSLG